MYMYHNRSVADRGLSETTQQRSFKVEYYFLLGVTTRLYLVITKDRHLQQGCQELLKSGAAIGHKITQQPIFQAAGIYLTKRGKKLFNIVFSHQEEL